MRAATRLAQRARAARLMSQRPPRLVLAAALVVSAMLISNRAGAVLPDPAADGWHSWRVAATPTAPGMCCTGYDGVGVVPCDLGNRGGGYVAHHGSARGTSGRTDEVRVFVRVEAGRPTDVRTLDAQCPVTAPDGIHDLGQVNADASAAWLAKLIEPRAPTSAGAIAAVAMHDSTVARDALTRTARAAASLDNRRDAVFWMGQARAHDSAGELERLMVEDSNASLRHHAIFSLSQMPDEGWLETLIALVENRQRPLDDRRQALFWMAQSEDDRAMDYLTKVLTDRRP